MSNKETILYKAISLFAQKGYNGVSVQEICESAGITKPTLYYFFKSKQGLLEAITQDMGGHLLEALTAAAVYEHDFIKGLTKILTTELSFAKEHKDFFVLHYTLLNAPEDSEEYAVYAPLAEKILSVFTVFFKNASNEFGNMRGKEKLYALLYHNNVTSLAASSISKKIRMSEQTIYQIVHSFVYGVAQ